MASHRSGHYYDHEREQEPEREPVPLSQRLLLRPEEAAAMLGLGRTTIYELLRAGELRAVHIGRARRIPSHLDIHAARRRFAQATYLRASGGCPLPSSQVRLAKGAIDPVAAQQVSQALGHNRLDVTTTHYLR